MGARRSPQGLAEIRTAVDRMTVLADWMEKFKPACTVMTLWPRDFNAICRNPDASARFKIIVPPSGRPRWRQFELVTVGTASPPSGGPHHTVGQGE